MRESVWNVLTRHFFNALFDFGFLSDAGAESFKRLLMGIAAVGLGLGLLLLRVFLAKYANLADGPADEYQRALIADHAFLMALPMWIAATAVVLTGHSLFPDETDFRILMAQPVSRATVFGAKLSALCLFAGLFIVGAHVALAPLIVVTMISPNAGAMFGTHAAAFGISTLAASGFAVLAVVSIHGVIVLMAPRAHVIVIGALVRSALLAMLVLCVPLVLRLPAATRAFASDARWLTWAPPAWFVGLERWLLGDSSRSALAFEAAVATLTAAGVAFISYAILYRRFDRVALRPGGAHEPQTRTRWTERQGVRNPVGLAVGTFTAITLRRSVLHQGIVVALTAAAAGFIVNDLVVQFSRSPGRDPIDAAAWSLVWAPFALMLIASVAVRLALLVPIELRANWIFRMTEDPATRADAVGSALWTVVRLGVVLPIVMAIPVQWIILGSRTWIAIGIELAIGWLLAEILMRDWRRLPFTCAYVPGKGFVPQMFVRGLLAFTAFTTVSCALVYGSLARPEAFPFIVVLATGPAAALMARRRHYSRVTDLAFEDELPTEVSPLRLHVD